jgi:hypothetical protein
MFSRLHSLWQTPQRVSVRRATVLGGLATLILVLAATELFLVEDWPRFVHVSALVLVSLTTLAIALGSVLPEERVGKALRDAAVPLGLLMFGSSFAVIARHRDRPEDDVRIVALIITLVGAVAMHLTRRK